MKLTNPKKLIFALLVIIVIQFGIILALFVNKNGLGADILKKGIEVQTLEAENNSLKNLIKLKDIRYENMAKGANSELQARLAEDLTNKPDLILYEGVKGGQMNFFDKEGIKIINERWVIAPFDDGHINGYALLEYEIGKEKKIKWRVISSYLEK